MDTQGFQSPGYLESRWYSTPYLQPSLYLVQNCKVQGIYLGLQQFYSFLEGGGRVCTSVTRKRIRLGKGLMYFTGAN